MKKDVTDEMFKYIKAIPYIEERGKIVKSPCPCGGTLICIRSPYNGHIHVNCDSCDFVLME